ncbi:MAG: YchJ family protein [Acidimicrobiales bacterium]
MADPGGARCPCGTGETYDRCCGRLHRGEAQATTAEQLMRSRYSAYAVLDEPYLLHSWHPSTRPRVVALDPDPQWVQLEIVATDAGGPFDQEGTVEFLAHHQRDGQPGVLHETSRFPRFERRWVYLDAGGRAAG